MAFARLEPFGTEIDFLGHAVTASTVANVNREKGREAYKPSDFMPSFKEAEPQSVGEMLQIAQMYTLGLGGKDLRDQGE